MDAKEGKRTKCQLNCVRWSLKDFRETIPTHAKNIATTSGMSQTTNKNRLHPFV